MYPVTCKDGKEHDWREILDDGIVCKDCGTDQQTFEVAHKDYKKVTEATRALITILNGGSALFSATAMFEEMQHTHRTLQQSFIRALAGFIAKMAMMDTDLRNQAAVEWCEKVAQIECILPLI